MGETILREFVLSHNEVPGSLNAGGAGSRRHWGVAHREKKRWEGIFTSLLLAEKVPTHMLSCSVEATVLWRIKRTRDSSNYVAPIVKPLADCMVQGGWLTDDTDEFFSFTGPKFEYLAPWTVKDPRVKAILVLRLRARYPGTAPQAARGGADVR